jgi:UDPglucose 6-dehydrogenase
VLSELSLSKIGVVGIGRVGLPFAAVCSKHFNTIGIDVDEGIIAAVNNGATFAEQSLTDYLHLFELKASTDFSRLSDRDIVFFFVGSQTPGVGYSSKKLLMAMEAALPHFTKNQIVVISTTIPPSELHSSILPSLERLGVPSKIRGLAYNPAMIALGNVIRDFERPSYVLIGESKREVGDTLEEFWRTIVGKDIPIFRSTMSNIALAKYALNMALVMKISLMSLTTELSERQRADVDAISAIFKAEPRIAGPGMFRGGLGYGGTCFPVDVEAIRHECEILGIPTDLADGITRLNEWQVTRSVSLVKSFKKKRVAVLGVTYKPNTAITMASQALEIARQLAEGGLDVTIYDPEGIPEARKSLGAKVSYAENAMAAISKADLVFIAVDWPEFRLLGEAHFRPDQIVVDPWRILKTNPPKCVYRPYGIAGS